VFFVDKATRGKDGRAGGEEREASGGRPDQVFQRVLVANGELN